jgi:hypothetical protein
MLRADGGKFICCTLGQLAKAALSIRSKVDLASNEIDKSEYESEKHDLHKWVTDDGIKVIINPE